MKITPPSALAAWAVGTAWLVLFVVVDRFDAYWGAAIHWIQAASFLVALAFYPFFKRRFAAWLAKRSR
jgi:hypothetical protein